MDRCVRVPTWAKRLIFVMCWPAALLSGCATVQPKMPPAIKYSYSGEHGDAVFYADAPCSAIVMQMIPPDIRPQFHGGEGTYDGPKYALCWAQHPNEEDVIFILWEDGGQGALGKEILKPGTGV